MKRNSNRHSFKITRDLVMHFVDLFCANFIIVMVMILLVSVEVGFFPAERAIGQPVSINPVPFKTPGSIDARVDSDLGLFSANSPSSPPNVESGKRFSIDLHASTGNPINGMVIFSLYQVLGPTAELGPFTGVPDRFDFSAPVVTSNEALAFRAQYCCFNTASNPKTTFPFSQIVAVNVIPQTVPTARVGPDLITTTNQTVILDGSGSVNPVNTRDGLSYAWSMQGAKPPQAHIPRVHEMELPIIQLYNSETAHPSFVAPVVQTPKLVTFTLVVNQGNAKSNPVSMEVLILPKSNHTS